MKKIAKEASGHFPANLPQLAEKIETVPGWTDLPLAVADRDNLVSIARSMKSLSGTPVEPTGRPSVLPSRRGSLLLFEGADAALKLRAAGAFAAELALPLYRIDLSRVVSKYIGETEKNLSAIFETASRKNWILYFDEADALFGKRSEVKDSHDRYANIGIDYLLQRLESYPGVAILAASRKESIDSAFLRRIRSVMDFPKPGSKIE